MQTLIRRSRPLTIGFLIALLNIPTSYGIEHTPKQGETLKAMVEILEERHYAGITYDDRLSKAHLDGYILGLDPQKMFFTQSDINQFTQWNDRLDDLSRAGDPSPAFAIFTLYQERTEARLNHIIDHLDDMVARFDFTKAEYIEIDPETIAWAEDSVELDDRWRRRIKNQVLSLQIAGKDDAEIAPTLQRRYEAQRKRMSQYNQQDIFQLYANSLAEAYDPHTSYFSPRNAENFDINMSLSFDGIGAVLQVDDEYVKVSRIVPAGPADKQGELKPSDLIIGVGQDKDGSIEDVIGWRLDEVVDKIRGPRDSFVRLEVIPDKGKMDQRRVITIQRNQVKLEEQAAKGELLDVSDDSGASRKIGVITVPAFYIDFAALRAGDPNYKSTTRDVAAIIEDLTSQGAEGLIIDLRNNGGGSLQEANDLTGLFIEYGPTVQIRSAERRVWRDGKRRRSDYYEGPVAVLINRLSASASEIFAGAIQDYGRGLVLGETSFGKGTVQSLLELPEGTLKVTESKFYRISGDSTQHRGVEPDIHLPSLFDPTEIGESALDNALTWDQISPVRHENYQDWSEIVPVLESRFRKRTEADPDFRFLLDQVALAQASRTVDRLPLSKTERMKLRDEQEAKALAIENRKRSAKGLPPLAELAEEADDDNASTLNDEDTGEVAHSADSSQDDDVILRQSSYILLDAMTIKAPLFAKRRDPVMRE
jgi:carboxyl-terminal processing protease